MSKQIMDRILEEQDREFTRVLEDLIEVLIDQGVISLEMFPPKAAEKFEQRRHMRMMQAFLVVPSVSPDADGAVSH
jgi:hypothetical protein